MCSILLSYKTKPDCWWQIAANRDEWFERETRPPYRWSSHPPIVGGQDLKSFGTWFAIQPKNGIFAALTNLQSPASLDTEATVSRGLLIPEILKYPSARAAAMRLGAWYRARCFSGFQIVFGDRQHLFYASSLSPVWQPLRLEPGDYVLCNRPLFAPHTPKVKRLRRYLDVVNTYPTSQWMKRMESVLKSRETAAVPHQTEFEQALTALNVVTEAYGTRSALVASQLSTGTIEYRATAGNPIDSPFIDFSHLFG